jgi:acetyl/propionyl-CoA carboxylase alpha subunit
MPRDSSLILRDGADTEYAVEIRDDSTVLVNGREVPTLAMPRGEVRVGGRLAWTVGDGDLRWVFIDGRVYTFDVGPASAPARPRRHDSGSLTAPMPATVIKILAAPGDQVRSGDVLLILEAMKMELPVRASSDGIVAAIGCRVGELVQPGQHLIEITA